MNYASHTGIPAHLALCVLNFIYAPRLDAATQDRKRRQQFLHDLHTLAEDGKIAIVESGMDCDCVQYANRVRLVSATKEAVMRECDSISDAADGPFSLRLERPSEAARLHYVSSDLAMEAHEDGHDHVVYAH